MSESWALTPHNSPPQIFSFCLTQIYHTPANKSCDTITKAFQPLNQNQSPTKSLFFVTSLTGRQTERSASVLLIRQAWVIKKEIRHSVWERPSGPLLIYSQLIVLAFYCFLFSWQIRQELANKKPAKICPCLEASLEYAWSGTDGKGRKLQNHKPIYQSTYRIEIKGECDETYQVSEHNNIYFNSAECQMTSNLPTTSLILKPKDL